MIYFFKRSLFPKGEEIIPVKVRATTMSPYLIQAWQFAYAYPHMSSSFPLENRYYFP